MVGEGQWTIDAHREGASTSISVSIPNAREIISSGLADVVHISCSLSFIDGAHPLLEQSYELVDFLDSACVSLDPRGWGRVFVDASFELSGRAVGAAPQAELAITSPHYKLALLRDYYPTMQFSNLIFGAGGSIGDGPVLVFLLRDLWDWTQLPDNFFRLPTDGFEVPFGPSSPRACEFHPFTEIGSYVSELLELDPSSTIELYLSDICLIDLARMLMEHGIDESRLSFSLLADGSYSLTAQIERYRDDRNDVTLHTDIAYWTWLTKTRKHQSFQQLPSLEFLTNGVSFTGYDRDSRYYLFCRDYLAEALPGPYARRLLHSDRVHELSSTQAYLDGDSVASSALSKLYRIPCDLFDEARRGGKKPMIVSIDSKVPEAAAAVLVKSLMGIYGPDWAYFYKQHPRMRSGYEAIVRLSDSFPEGCRLEKLPVEYPLDIILAANPDSRLCSTVTTAFSAIPEDRRAVLILTSDKFSDFSGMQAEPSMPMNTGMDLWALVDADLPDELADLGTIVPEESGGFDWLVFDSTPEKFKSRLFGDKV